MFHNSVEPWLVETGISGQTWWCLGCTVALGSSVLSSSGCADGNTVPACWKSHPMCCPPFGAQLCQLCCRGARDSNLISGDLKISKNCRSSSSMWPFLIRQWIMLKQLGSALFHKGCGCERLAWLVQVGIPSLLCEPQPEGSPHEPVRPVTKKGEHMWTRMQPPLIHQTLNPPRSSKCECSLWGTWRASNGCLRWWAGRGQMPRQAIHLRHYAHQSGRAPAKPRVLPHGTRG